MISWLIIMNSQSFQITATIRPDRDGHDEIKRFLDAGASRLRINLSHLIPAALPPALTVHAQCEETLQQEIPLVLDLQGRKFRIRQGETRTVTQGETIWLTRTPTADRWSVPHDEFFSALSQGMILRIDDGRVRVRCLTVQDDIAVCEVIDPGLMRPGAGVVLPGSAPLTGITARDREFIQLLDGFSPRIEVALSHCRSATDMRELRAFQPARRHNAKIELKSAFPQLQEIATASDELWLCRGDLGADAGLFPLPDLEAEFFQLRERTDKPLILAGQVLHVFAAKDGLTRSERVYLAGHLRAGLAGVVLSDETLHSADPVAPVKALRDLADEYRPGVD